MKEELNKLKIAFPVTVSRVPGCTSVINPYEEFAYHSIEKYYDRFADVHITCEKFATMSQPERRDFIIEKLGDLIPEDVRLRVDTDPNGEPVVIVERVTGDTAEDKPNELFMVATEDATYVVQDSCFGEGRKTIFVDMRRNAAFDYLFDEQTTIRTDTDEQVALTGQMIMLNDVPGYDCQVAFSLCLMAGMIHFNEYQKYHKMTATKTSGIASYINTKMNFGGVYKTHYSYDCMYIVYSNDEKYAKETTKVAKIPYAGYAAAIDEFVDELVAGKSSEQPVPAEA